MSKNGLGFFGWVIFIARDRETGIVKAHHEGPNLVTDVGLDMIAATLDPNSTDDDPSHIALGTSDTAPAGGQTDLQGTELARDAFASTTLSAPTVEFKASFTGTFTGTIEEAGLFNASSGGSMFARFLTGTYDKDSNDDLDIIWKLTAQRP